MKPWKLLVYLALPTGLAVLAVWYFTRRKQVEVLIPTDKPGAFVSVKPAEGGKVIRYEFDSSDTTFGGKKALK